MTLNHPVFTACILGAAVTIALLAAGGFWLMRGAFNKLHYVAPVTLFSTVLVALAVVVEHPAAPATAKVVATALLLVVGGPVVTHLTARAARHRRRGELDIKQEEAGSRS